MRSVLARYSLDPKQWTYSLLTRPPYFLPVEYVCVNDGFELAGKVELPRLRLLQLRPVITNIYTNIVQLLQDWDFINFLGFKKIFIATYFFLYINLQF